MIYSWQVIPSWYPCFEIDVNVTRRKCCTYFLHFIFAVLYGKISVFCICYRLIHSALMMTLCTTVSESSMRRSQSGSHNTFLKYIWCFIFSITIHVSLMFNVLHLMEIHHDIHKILDIWGTLLFVTELGSLYIYIYI